MRSFFDLRIVRKYEFEDALPIDASLRVERLVCFLEHAGINSQQKREGIDEAVGAYNR
jgi:hypothetical protein